MFDQAMPRVMVTICKQCLIYFFLLLGVAHAQTPFEITSQTPIQFKDKNHVLVYVDTEQQAQYQDVLKLRERFVPAAQIGPFKPYVRYWVLQKMVSKLDADADISIDPTGWKDVTSYVIRSNGDVNTLKTAGWQGAHNPYLSDSPEQTTRSKYTSQFPIFKLKAGEEVTLLTRVNFNPLFPAKSFSIHFKDSAGYAEYRRFSLYIEGILLGILMSLVIFAWFNAIQNNDRTNLFYAIWITSAFASIFSIGIIDGERLFEFFINIEGLRAANTETYGYTITFVLAFSQSILYVLFARQYLGIQQHFPKIYAFSNLWVMFALLHGFLSLSGSFYPQDALITAPSIAMVYGISVAFMLITLFVCSFLRYRDGFGFAIFFSFAIFPYLIFRTNFLLGIIGVPSLFSYLPDHAFGYFLKNPWTNQAFGVCLEAMIMGMAVFSRTRWLQQELTLSAQKQTELIEKQNLILEDTVAQRTQELSAKHEIVLSSVNYASRLQRGQLPRPLRIDGRFASFATIWEPRDTIGGDLYWLSNSQHAGPFVLAVADCTGHGVPGAMLSLLVSNSLERIYANDTSEDPVTALLSLDRYVRTGLNQDRPDSESDDGCDAAVLRIDRQKQTIEFAGAKLGLFQINANGVVTRHPGARCSLGYQDAIHDSDRPLLQTIHCQAGDVFALVTDGFTDQIGGAQGKTSFGYRRLEDILKTNCSSSAEAIVAAMKHDFAQWQGSNQRRDDVTAVVFKL